MKCNVILDNGAAVFTAAGTLEYADAGFRLSYGLDGDNCLLVYDGKKLYESRRGSLCLEMTFSAGEKTTCTLSDGAAEGSFPLFTHSLAVTENPNGFEISVRYDFSGEITELKITVKIN